MERYGAARLDDLVTSARAAARDAGAALEAEVGFGVDQWRVLRRLDTTTGVAMGELGESLCAAPATLTRLVDGLVDRGLAFRSVTDGDRRRVLVVLSSEGEAARSRAEAVLDARVETPQSS